jgi:hypothetical protein
VWLRKCLEAGVPASSLNGVYEHELKTFYQNHVVQRFSALHRHPSLSFEDQRIELRRDGQSSDAFGGCSIQYAGCVINAEIPDTGTLRICAVYTQDEEGPAGFAFGVADAGYKVCVLFLVICSGGTVAQVIMNLGTLRKWRCGLGKSGYAIHLDLFYLI